MRQLCAYLERTRPEFQRACRPYMVEFERGLPTHPGRQRRAMGLALHTVQVIEKALSLNQEFAERDIIETCIAHDLKQWDALPLLPLQTAAIMATKGMRWELWRKKTHHSTFIALILIADMWSAYVNVENRRGGS